MNHNNNIPTLRFPEFSEEWEEKKLDTLGYFLGGGTPESSNKEYWKGNIAWISSSDIKEGSIHYINKTRFITEKAIKESATKIIPKMAILMVSRVGIGKFAVADDELCTSQDFTNLITNENSFFLAYFFTSKANRFVRLSQGTSIKGFTGKDIKNAKFAIPQLPEQQKIASFLTAVDSKIELLQKKKQGLERYKKGIMQKIFSQELRFKDENGNDYPDWEEKKYNEIYTFYYTNSFSRDNLNYDDGKVMNIHYGDIHTKFSTLFNIEKELVPFVNFDIDLSKIKDENYCKKGDLVIADASEDYKDIGKTIEIINLNEKKVLAGLHTFLARPNKFEMAIGFSGYMLQIWAVRKQVMKIAQGTKVLGIATGRLGNLELKIPCLEEQNQIANFLSAIDAKIELVSTQLKNTQQFKKGLLQQMFV